VKHCSKESDMTTVALNLDLPPQEYQRLVEAARARQRPVAEVVQTALSEWLASEERLQQARAAMREFGQGLGTGPATNDVARRHDDYLYSRNQA
jgi:Arc/MetJ-type ribon-helix-helix transcriptional regulator